MYFNYISFKISARQFARQFWLSLKNYRDDVTEVGTRAGRLCRLKVVIVQFKI